MRRETIAIHGGYEVDPTTKAVAVPIYQTVAYAFDSADHGAALFNLETDGYRYTRIGNPTTAVLERRVAALEGGLEALCVSSGQAAVHYATMNVTELGSNIVSVPQLYGTTHTLFAHVLPNQGVSVRFAASDCPDAMEKLIDDQTRAIYCESVGNPAGNICDIEALARVAHKHGVPLIVDNTVATPILLRPIEYGADIVVHSLTKFLGGHGTTLGGAIVDGGTFPWKAHSRRFAMFSRPDPSYHNMVYTDHYKEAAYIGRCRSVYQRTTGSALSPFSAFLLLQGIETVALRIDRHVENGRRVAEFLRSDHRVAWVNYAGFPENAFHERARRYLGGRACSLMTFGVKGGFEAGKKFYDALTLIKRVANLGDAKSLACHPASTTHRQMSADEQHKAGVAPETIRLSVGIEHIDDIIADLDRALDADGISSARSGQMITEGQSSSSSSDLAVFGRAQRRRRTPPARSRESDPNCIDIGLVNNMPDPALDATERQFRALLDAAANGLAVRVTLYTLPEVPRSEFGRRQVSRYASLDELWDRRHDGLIVTGTEPLAADLKDEPFWGSLTRVLEWAERYTHSTILSCLAAHAGILHTDGIVRRPLGDKRFGVFECVRVSDHPLTAAAPGRLQMPHSRWNEIPEEALLACGYRVLTRSEDAGVDAFVKQRRSLFVFLQGHPEYDAITLLLEYRRDIGRFLRRERDAYPSMPQGYFDPEIVEALTALRERALSDRREELLAEFPIAMAAGRVTNNWRSTAESLYRNWLLYIRAEKNPRLRAG